MLPINLSGKRAFVAGVADDRGYGWAFVRALASAGASICIGTWPPVLRIFTRSLERGKFDRTLPDGGEIQFEKVYPLDAAFDTADQVPEAVRDDKRYVDLEGYTIQGVADQMQVDFGDQCLDIVVHSLANGPEVRSPLIETTRDGYLAAVSSSAYSMVSMTQRFAPLMNKGGALVSLSYLAAERVIPGYGGGMNAAKAALESDTRMLAYEAGRKFDVRINTISAGPLPSRAASAIGAIDRLVEYYRDNAALPEVNSADDVGNAAAFLCSDLAAGITGETLHVDKGYHIMGMPAQTLLRDEAE